MGQRIPIERRFATKVPSQPANGCWIWAGATNKDGYGSFWSGQYIGGDSRRGPVMVLAHRWAYEQFIGSIPAGLCVLHHCDTPPCVNPAHFFLGPQLENVRDCIVKGRHAYGRKTLTTDEEEQVRAAYRGEYGDLVRLAAQFDVSKRIVARVVAGLPRRGRIARP